MINFLNQSLWLDEATTALVAKMNFMDIITKFLPGDFHPPLYYLVMRLWAMIFGTSEIALRAPSYIFGLLTIYLIYKISKNSIAPILLATSGLFVYYAGEARMYMMATFLVTASFYFFINKKWLSFSIVLALAGMTNYLALLVLPVFWFIGYKDKKFLLSHVPLVVSYVAWSPFFLRQLSFGMSAGSSRWGEILGQPTFKNLLLIPVKFIFGRISFDNKLLYALLAIIGIALFGYLIYKARKSLKLYVYWLFIPILLGFVIGFFVPVLTYFRFLFCLPALYILVSQSQAKRVFIYLALIINLLSTIYYVQNTRFWREDWRGASEAIGDGQIILPADSQKEALIYYGKNEQITKEPTENVVWLSRYVWEIFDPEDLTRQKLESLGYNKASEHNFNGVVFWKYLKNNYYASSN